MSKKGVTIREITIKSKEESLYHSFHVRIKVSDLDQVLQPDFWPVGVNVRRYWPPRNQSAQTWQ